MKMETTKTSSDKIRVQFDFSKKSLDKLDEIVEAAGAASRAEVLRRALVLITEVMAAEERDAKVLIREKDGTLIQLLTQF